MSEVMPYLMQVKRAVVLRLIPQSTQNLGDETQQIMRHHAKSFDWAARFLSLTTRDDTRLLYAFARLADDLADEPALGALPERLATLASMKRDLCHSSLNGDALIHAVACLRERHALPMDLFDYFLDSLMADAHPRCVLTQHELMVFAYGVAGTVGLMMRPLLGAPPEANPYALALGLAMQLTNIARDVVEDAQRGRTYIPASLGVTGDDLLKPKDAEDRRKAFAAIAQVLTWSEAFYAFAEQGLVHIPKPNQSAIRIALALYRGIGRKILQHGPERYWQGRAQLSRLEKIQLTLAALMGLHRHRQAELSSHTDVLRILHTLSDLPGFPSLCSGFSVDLV